MPQCSCEPPESTEIWVAVWVTKAMCSSNQSLPARHAQSSWPLTSFALMSMAAADHMGRTKIMLALVINPENWAPAQGSMHQQKNSYYFK